MSPDRTPRQLQIVCTIAVLFALLSSCASLPGQGERQIGAPAGEFWQMRGKLGVRSDNGNANLRFSWHQEGARFSILLDTVLGHVVARIRGNATRVTLEMPGEEPVTSDRVEELTRQLLGWSFPVANIVHWLRGEPAPIGPYEVERSSDGHVVRLVQSGWTIRYDGDESPPARMRFQRDDVALRVVIQTWEWGEGSE